MYQDPPQIQTDKLWIGNLDLRVTEFKLLQILQRYGEIENFNFVYHTAGPNLGQPKGFAFVKYKKAEDTLDVLTRLNNKKIGHKNIAIRYAKHVDHQDDKGASKMKIPALQAGSSSKASIIDQKNKIHLIEEQLKSLQSSSNDFVINRNAPPPSEPIIKKYQFNKDAPQSSSRYQSYHKKKRRPY